MKIIKFTIPVFVFALSVSFLAAANAEQASASKSNAKAKTQNEKIAPKTDQLRDPFEQYIPNRDGGFVNSNNNGIPSGIKVLGILIVENKKAIAALMVPNSDDPLYVRENDIIGIEVTKTGGSSGSKAKTAEIVYLKIDKITSQQVIVTPKNNPAGKQILR